MHLSLGNSPRFSAARGWHVKAAGLSFLYNQLHILLLMYPGIAAGPQNKERHCSFRIKLLFTQFLFIFHENIPGAARLCWGAGGE